MIVTSQPYAIIEKIHKNYNVGDHYPQCRKEPIIHQEKAVLRRLLRVQSLMIQIYYGSPQAFITISENVHIIGRFVETGRSKNKVTTLWCRPYFTDFASWREANYGRIESFTL